MKMVFIKEWALEVIVFEEGQVPIRNPDAAYFTSAGKMRDETQSTLDRLRSGDTGVSD